MQNQTKSKSALIIVDLQNDFCEDGGSLGVKDSLQIIPKINEIRNLNFDHIILTRDFHPQNHISFASNHKEQQPFTVIELENGQKQELWPDHCVQGTKGVEYHKQLVVNKEKDIEILKGTKQQYECYSGFGIKEDDSGLNKILKDLNVQKVFVVGLAYDYCVGSTAIDSCKNEFQTFVISDATKSVSPDTEKIMDQKLNDQKNYMKINSSQIQQYL